MNIRGIQESLLEKIFTSKIKIPNQNIWISPEEFEELDADEFESRYYLPINNVKELLYSRDSLEEIIEFIKEYIFHINYVGGVILQDYLESIIPLSTLQANGIYLNNIYDPYAQIESKLNSDVNIFLGNAAYNVLIDESFSRPSHPITKNKIEIRLFDYSKIRFYHSSVIVLKLNVTCRHNSELLLHETAKNLSVTCMDFSKCAMEIGLNNSASIVAHQNSEIKATLNGMSNSWIRIFDKSTCQLSLSDNCYVRVHNEVNENVQFAFSASSRNLNGSECGPIYVDEIRNKIYVTEGINVQRIKSF